MIFERNKPIFNLGRVFDFDEIPTKPETSNFWMIEATVALWFSGLDNKWRFMLMSMSRLTRRSGESFKTKTKAEEFYKSGKVPTWVKGSIVKELDE